MGPGCTCLVFGAEALRAFPAVEEVPLLVEEYQQRRCRVPRGRPQHLRVDLHEWPSPTTTTHHFFFSANDYENDSFNP